jgi:hypothetical protein
MMFCAPAADSQIGMEAYHRWRFGDVICITFPRARRSALAVARGFQQPAGYEPENECRRL